MPTTLSFRDFAPPPGTPRGLDLINFAAFEEALSDLKPGDTFDAGWVPPVRFDARQAEWAGIVHQALPRFQLRGNEDTKSRAVLWDCSRPVNGGKHFDAFYQQTGSCVGNGLGKAVWYLLAVEAVRLGKLAPVKLPFWLLPYGRSRSHAGMRGRGEGSFGAAAAWAIVNEGILPADQAGLDRKSVV